MSELENSTSVEQKDGLMGWIDARLPVTKTLEKHMTKYYAPKNFNV